MTEATKLDEFIIEQAPTGDDLRAELKRRAALKQKAEEAVSNKVERRANGARSLNEAEVIVVKKILSCIARIEKEFGKNKFGKGTVAAVLRGSTSKQVLDNHLNRLSTYGLLKDAG
jgi:superfamily II DNA helicase RecQ